MDSDFLKERIEKIKALIIIYEEAITSIAGGAQHYRLDTGQSSQTVTKANIEELTNKLNSLYNLLAVLNLRLKGSGSTQVRPGY